MQEGIFKFPTELGILETKCKFQTKEYKTLYFIYVDLISPSLEILNEIKKLYEIHLENANERRSYAMIKKCFKIKCENIEHNFIGCLIIKFKDNFIKISADKHEKTK
jgi:hypothetical protein